MAKRISIFICGILFLIMLNSAFAKEQELLNVIKRIVYEKIVPLAKEPIIVNAVKEANKEVKRSPDEIMRLDKQWMETKGIDEWIGSFINNPCANYLKKFQKNTAKAKRSLYSEIFIMDQQGNIVAETNKTSDYRQADEDKFIKSFADGKGAVFIDEPAFDSSSETFVVQVSVPVFDPGTKKAIGAMTAGIDLDILAELFVY